MVHLLEHTARLRKRVILTLVSATLVLLATTLAISVRPAAAGTQPSASKQGASTRAVNATLAFRADAGSAALRRQLARLTPIGPSQLTARFTGPHHTVTAGVAIGRGQDALSQYYTAQRRNLRGIVRRLARKRQRASGTTRLGIVRSLADARAFLRSLRANRALAFEYRGRFAGTALDIARRSDMIGRVRLGKQQRPDRPAARGRAADAVPSTDYMPRLWDADTSLSNTTLDDNPIPTPPPGPDGALSEKLTWIGAMWDSPQSLSWYSGDEPGMRGIELEATDGPGSDEWSNDWSSGDPYGETWASNLPDAYRDDLTSDTDTPNFAIGTAYGDDLELNVYYWGQFLTNHGQSHSGVVKITGDAVRRAADESQFLYCHIIRANADDEFCMFSEAKAPVQDFRTGALAHYPIGNGGAWEQYPRVLPPPEIFGETCNGTLRMSATGTNATLIPSPMDIASPYGDRILARSGLRDINLYTRDGTLVRRAHRLDPSQSLKGLAYDPSGDSFWIGRLSNSVADTTNIYEVDLATGLASPRVTWPGDQYDPAVSPDGQTIAVFSDSTPLGARLGVWGAYHDYDGYLYVFPASGGQERLLAGPDKIDQGWSPQFSPDGTKIAFVANETSDRIGSVLVLDVATGQTVYALSEAPGYPLLAYSVAWLSNSRLVYSTYSSIRAIDLGGGNDVVLASTCDAGGRIITRAPSSL